MENNMNKTIIRFILFYCYYCFCFIPTNSFGTMLPLEVIEITHQQQKQQQQQQYHHHQIPSSVEHSTQVHNISSLLSSKSVSSSPLGSESESNVAGLNSRWNNLLNLNSNNNNNNNNNNSNIYNNSRNTNTNDIKHKFIYNNNNSNNNHHPEKRRSRQMLDVLLQPQGTRILYQVGESEEDLPICAVNAVCSKIDLYETPWIERQCRCPDISNIPPKGPIIINHHKDRQSYDQQKYNIKHLIDTEQKPLLHRRLQNFDDKRLENIHLKRLMHKLDAVFQDDLLLNENVFRDNEKTNNPYHNNHKNDFDTGFSNEFHIKSHEINKLRHSGHHRDFPKIGGCSSSLGIDDGHTIADKTRHYKLCNPIHKLPICRYFRDYTWSLSSSPEMNITEQIVHCRCPKNSITYLTKREPLSSGRPGYTYLFACSPQSRLRCQRKEPCKLFTLRKRQEFLDEVNTNPLCQCPKGHRCPKHHTDPGVIAGKFFIEDNIQTYSGYCMAND